MDKEIQKELLNKTSSFINEAAKTLGNTTEHVYSVLVKQQAVDGITTLIGVPLATFISYKACKALWKIAEKKMAKDSYSMWDVSVWPLMIGVILSIFGITAWMMAGLSRLINPEFYAIKFIFDSIGG